MPIVYKRDAEYSNMVISTVKEPFNPTTDPQAGLAQLTQFLSEIEGKVYIVSDMREFDASFSDIVMGMAAASYRKDSPVRNDRVVIAQVAVGQIFEMMEDWFKQEQYGKLDLPLFKTIEEARQYLANKMEQPQEA